MTPPPSIRLTPLLLAQQQQPESGGMASVIVWSLIIIVLVIAGFYAISWVRKWMKDDDLGPSRIGFTLGDLRDLHRRGEMTDEEYEKAKAKIVSGTQTEAEKIKPASEAAKDSVDAIRARTAARRAEQTAPRAAGPLPPRDAGRVPPRAPGGIPPPLRPPSDKSA